MRDPGTRKANRYTRYDNRASGPHVGKLFHQICRKSFESGRTISVSVGFPSADDGKRLSMMRIEEVITRLQTNHIQKTVEFNSNFLGNINLFLNESIIANTRNMQNKNLIFNWGDEFNALKDICRIPGVKVEAHFLETAEAEAHALEPDNYFYVLDSETRIVGAYVPYNEGT